MNLDDRPQPVRLTAHLVFGLLIIFVGVVFTLDNMDLVDARDYVQYWPVGLIVLGLAKLTESRATGVPPVGGVLFTLIGTWLLLDNLGYLDISFLDFWPVLLVLIGAVIVYQGLRGGSRAQLARVGDTISAVAVLSGVSRGSNSAAFRGGELTAFMGGCEVDLRQAAIDGEAVLDVFVMWGGIDIKVPDNWTVISRVTPILGGFDDHTRPPQNAVGQRLIIRGAVIMGGIEVKN